MKPNDKKLADEAVKIFDSGEAVQFQQAQEMLGLTKMEFHRLKCLYPEIDDAKVKAEARYYKNSIQENMEKLADEGRLNKYMLALSVETSQARLNKFIDAMGLHVEYAGLKRYSDKIKRERVNNIFNGEQTK